MLDLNCVDIWVVILIGCSVMGKIWITRPTEDSSHLFKTLTDKGYDAFVEPLLDITFNEVKIDTKNCQAIVFTSANGVRAYIYNKGTTDLPVYAVGDATAREAKKAGFKIIHISQGDVVFLSETIKEHAKPEEGALYHGAGSVIAKDLSALLSAHKYAVKRQALYEAVPTVAISRTVCTYLKNGSISGILLMSPRTADIFVRTMRAQKLDNHLEGVIMFALSDAVADKLRSLNCKVVVASDPTQSDVISAIEEYISK